MKFIGKCIEVEIITFNQITQTQNDKYHIFTLLYVDTSFISLDMCLNWIFLENMKPMRDYRRLSTERTHKKIRVIMGEGDGRFLQ